MTDSQIEALFSQLAQILSALQGIALILITTFILLAVSVLFPSKK